MTMLHVEAPTDAQLVTIRSMTLERGQPYPQSIASKAEASEIIGALIAGTYDPSRYAYPFSMSDDSIPF